MVDVGHYEHDHGESIKPSLVCTVQLPPPKHLLEDDNERVQTADFTQPFVNRISGNQTQMAALFRFILSLHCDVCVDWSEVVLAVEFEVHGPNGWIEEGELSIDCKFY